MPSIKSPHPFLARAAQWTPCLAMMLLSFISLVDRSILAILSPTILRDLHLSATQYGNAILAFSICYMVANPIWGWLMDRLGLFAAIIAGVALWSFASGAHAFLSGFLGLCLARGLLGFGEGAAFPAGLKTVTETLPLHQRSFGLGLAYSGGSLGAILTPIVVVPLAARYGWRSTFVLSAAIGFVWIALWLLLRQVRLYTPVPSALPTSKPSSRSRWNRALIATAVIYGLGAAPIAFGLYAASLYLTRVLHQSTASLGYLLWIPPAGWEFGYLTWGRVADILQRRALAQGQRSISPFPLYLALALGSLLLAAIPLCAGLPFAVPLTMTIFFFVMFLGGGYVVLALAHGATTQAPEHRAFLAGFSISGFSLATGILMAIVGRWIDHGWFTQSFWLASACPLAGVLLWRLILPRPTANPHQPPQTV